MSENNSFQLIFNESMQEHIFTLAEVRMVYVRWDFRVGCVLYWSESGAQDVNLSFEGIMWRS